MLPGRYKAARSTVDLARRSRKAIAKKGAVSRVEQHGAETISLTRKGLYKRCASHDLRIQRPHNPQVTRYVFCRAIIRSLRPDVRPTARRTDASTAGSVAHMTTSARVLDAAV